VLALASLEQSDPAPIVDRADDGLAALLYTGGTRGRAKGVMLSHDNLYFTGGAGHDAGHLEGVNRALATLPLSHACGLLVTIVGTHSTDRGVAALLRWFEPTACLTLIEEHRPQLSAVVPSMLQVLLSQALEDHDL
jgi:long-chain acyl-CoA synthetase